MYCFVQPGYTKNLLTECVYPGSLLNFITINELNLIALILNNLFNPKRASRALVVCGNCL